jgi:fumarate hydratase class I
VLIDAGSGAIKQWLYRDPRRPVERLVAGAGFQVSGREIRLETPLTEEKVRALKLGDVVLINGPVVTGRDAAHHYLMHHDAPCDLKGAILYHCGPVMMKEGTPPHTHWRTHAAGPTTSSREEPYEADVIKRFGIRAVMGKGGMGEKTLAGLKEHGAVYLHAIGGAAQFYARCLPKVRDVYLLEELGIPEAMWVFEAKDFPAIVTMDSHGNSLHAVVSAATGTELEKVGAAESA